MPGRHGRATVGLRLGRSHNLPSSVSSLVGRQQALAEVLGVLQAARLVTLTGAGGVGKTRLALSVAAAALPAYPDGVWMVSLAPLQDPALVPQVVAATLGVPERAGRPLLATLTEGLREQRALLVLDNCEHLVQTCAELAEALLGACPALRMLATSREPLGVAGEVTWRVPSLGLPPPPPPQPPLEQLSQYAAVRLFVERAVAARPDFQVTNTNAPAVAQVCWRLDGIPLAIELAAAWVRTLSVEQLAARLDDRFRLLVGGSRTAPARQQTLRGTIEWSNGLLDEVERRLFRRLAVFAGGWTLEAAEVVCADELPAAEPARRGERPVEIAAADVLGLLAHLVDKSLIVVEETSHGTARYRLLETLRLYGQERVREAGELPALERRHRDWVLALAEALPPEQMDPQHIAHLAQEQDNLRAALRGTIARGETEGGLRLGVALWSLWYVRGLYTEGRTWLGELLALPGADAATPARARALTWAGHLAYCEGDFATAQARLEEALTTARGLGAEQEEAVALLFLALIPRSRGDLQLAEDLYQESLTITRRLGHRVWAVFTLNNLALMAERWGDAARAETLGTEALALARAVEHQPAIPDMLGLLGRIALGRREYATARHLLEEAAGLQRAQGFRASAVLVGVGPRAGCARRGRGGRGWPAPGRRAGTGAGDGRTGNAGARAGRRGDAGSVLAVRARRTAGRGRVGAAAARAAAAGRTSPPGTLAGCRTPRARAGRVRGCLGQRPAPVSGASHHRGARRGGSSRGRRRWPGGCRPSRFADAARAGGGGVAGAGADQPADRRGALDQRGHRAHPRRARAGETRAPFPSAGRGLGAGPRAARRTPRLRGDRRIQRRQVSAVLDICRTKPRGVQAMPMPYASGDGTD